ncbi:LrgB family protein [Acidovorax sp. MR-S7]|jgi:putative effector of murein hydrolase|uniref:LrgB family protein n=1 Tax=Acidovorax sp. MR-S7 TaxID=1268622 RepID=UPI00036181F3|nr:LrgB family protein [Acidovorax sp. MR-S7]GAD20896.1 putative effector of murein hydrolase [Acidovorax sp. MR-S7]
MDALTAWLAASPLPWLVLTMLAYTFTLAVYRRSGAHPLLIPPLTATALVVAVLLLTGTPYATYREGVGLLSFLIGPATVALAVPLFAQRERIRQLWRPIGVALLVGGTVAIVSALLIAWALGGTRETLMALAPKSATMPIALPVAERMGGPASLAAVAVAITGIAGAVLAAPLMRLLRVHDPAVRGFAIGLTAHAIGTARELQVHPTAGAFAALAMSLNGVATAVLVPLCVAAMPWL